MRIPARATPPPDAHAAQARLFALVDRASLRVDRAVAGVWAELLQVIRQRHGYAADRLRVAAVLRRLPAAVAGEMHAQLAALVRQGHAQAAGVLARRLRRPVREDRASDLADWLFPPPAEHWVRQVLAPFVRPHDWERVGTDAHRRMPQDLADELAARMSQGDTPREVAKAALPYLDGSRHRAARAARTFGLHVAHQGQQAAWDQAGDLIAGWTVHATLDSATRPEHRARDGTTYWKSPGPGQKGLDEMPRPPLEADGSIAWNCLLPGNVVQGRIVGGSKMRYAGKAVEVVTASGLSVRVTANHPVLAAKGFVAAQRLKKGDNLIRYVDGVHGLADCEHNAPAAVENVFGALVDLPGVVAVRPGVLDLHGDEQFREGDVEVVLAQGMLPTHDQPAGRQGVGDRGFVRGAGNQTLVSSLGASLLSPQGIPLPPPSGVGPADLPFAGVRTHSRPLDFLSIGPAAKIDASLYEQPHQARRAPDAALGQVASRDAGFARELLERFPGEVALDEVVEVRHFEFAGHVYDLQGAGGWIVANGLFQHNCRCYLTPVLSEESASLPAPEPALASPSFGPSAARVELNRPPEQARPLIDLFLGASSAHHDFASAVGAPAASVVRLGVAKTEGRRKFLDVTITGAHFNALRQISVEPDGSKVVTNMAFYIDEGHQGQGLGSEVFGRQVEQCARLGFARIDTYAAKGPDANGYYTWPRLGYNAPVPDYLRAQMPAGLADAPTLLDLYARPGGKEWWKAHGDPLDLSFDLRAGSRSRQVLAAYLRERQARAAAKEAREGRRRRRRPARREEPDLSAADHAALDRLWAKIARDGWAAI